MSLTETICFTEILFCGNDTRDVAPLTYTFLTPSTSCSTDRYLTRINNEHFFNSFYSLLETTVHPVNCYLEWCMDVALDEVKLKQKLYRIWRM